MKNEEIFINISSKLDSQFNKLNLICLFDIIEKQENKKEILDFIIKNIEDIKWNKLLNSFFKIHLNISSKLIPIFKTFEKRVKEESFKILYKNLQQKEINLDKFNKLPKEKKVKFIMKIAWKSIEKTNLKFNLDFWNSFKDYKKSLNEIVDKNEFTEVDFDILLVKLSIYFIDRISLFNLLKSNLMKNWDFSFKLKEIRNIMIHSSIMISLSEEKKKLLKDFFLNDYQNILNKLEISTKWDSFIKQINNLEEEILIAPKNKEEDKKVKNTNYLLKLVLKEYKDFFIK